MLEYNSIEECSFRPDDQIVVALGFFDGIHLAHQRLIEECKKRAKARKGKSIVFTFQNHPSSVLTPDHPTPLLTPPGLKRRMLQSLGIDGVISAPFDESLCHTPAERFVRDVLQKRLCARELVVGFNFRFGHNREGTTDLLCDLVPSAFEAVTVIDQMFHDEIPISSSRIRQALSEGSLSDVESLLGHPYVIAGEVIRGDRRGRRIGVPTANLQSGEQILPPNGVYGVRVKVDHLDAPPRWGVMNIGNIPTFTDQTNRTIEVHLLDFEGDVYNRYLMIEIIQFIRKERKFGGPAELIAQIHADIESFRSNIHLNHP
ncbi:MAG: bifunctional riboflavin kinase/FAD synthetase [Candidatus Omnitrophica bacterium]|nr:bifunctional riboflavin kinase/FAD synthetase [Candidatus Omnitrophota bacterium]